MKTIDVVTHLINKNIVTKIVIKERRGPKGYPLYLRLRLLLFSILMEIFETRKLVRYLKKRKSIIKKLGFENMPSRRTIDRWKKDLQYELEQLIKIVGDNYIQLNNSEWTLLDSTPIIDENDDEASLGYNSQGPFKGFKLHISCDENEVPLRAVFTHANVHDSKKAEELLTLTPKAGADSAYDSTELKNKAMERGTLLITSHNPIRRGKKARKRTPRILKKVRVKIEQLNGFIKSQVMKHKWIFFKGLKAKATFCLTAVLAVQAIAIYNLKKIGYPSIRIADLKVEKI